MAEPERSVTTEDMIEAAGVVKTSLLSWVESGLLPKPRRVSLEHPKGWFYRWTASALGQARFVGAKRREGLSREAIRELLVSRKF